MTASNRLAALAVIIAIGLISSTAAAEPFGPPEPIPGVAPAVMPMDRPPLDNTRRAQFIGHLQYFGGPILPNVVVHLVAWGPNVDPATLTTAPDFFAAVNPSAYIDVLAEYDTTTQQIRHGSYGTTFVDQTPTAGAVVTDAKIQTELVRALNNGLAAPDASTLYVVAFPATVQVTDTQGNTTCNQICGYHNAFRSGGKNIYYAIIPDMGGGCSQGCGLGGKLANWERVTSHELTEAITDPQPPSGWYDINPSDSNGGHEIADICVSGSGDTGRIDGFTVQKVWSNEANACIAIRPPGNNDFNIGANPTATSVALGGQASFSVSTSVILGNPEPVTLSVNGLSDGVTAEISPGTTIMSGQTATVTLHAAADAPSLRIALDVKAAVNADFAHDVTVTVVVGTPGDFSMAITPRSQSVPIGGSATYMLTTAVVSQPIGDITLTAVDTPPGAKITFDPEVVHPGDSATATLVLASTATTGSHRLTVQGSSGGTVHTALATLNVTATATADAGPSGPDAGPATPDAAEAGMPDARTLPRVDAATIPVDEGGGCRVGGGGGSPAGILLVIGGLGLAFARRRRRG